MHGNLNRLAIHVKAQCGMELLKAAPIIGDDDLPAEIGDIRQVYRTVDFATCDPPVHFPIGMMQLLPWENAVALWQELAQYADEDDTEFFNETNADGVIRAAIYDRRRFPIAYDETATQYLYIDGIPGPAGKIGQLILNSSEASFNRVGSSVEEFFGHICDLLDKGDLAFRTVPAEYGAGFWVVDSAGNPVELKDLLASS